MTKRCLSHERIIDEAVAFVEEKGYDNFSLRELASRLGVKPASLYNHIEGLNEIDIAIATRAANKMRESLSVAVANKSPDEAFLAGTRAYRQFAVENPELYKAFVRMPSLNDKAVRHAGFESFSPLREVIGSYGLQDKERLHFIRGLRSVMHGFIELTNNGFMHEGRASHDETYEEIIRDYLTVLKDKSFLDKE